MPVMILEYELHDVKDALNTIEVRVLAKITLLEDGGASWGVPDANSARRQLWVAYMVTVTGQNCQYGLVSCQDSIFVVPHGSK